jgi:hypothetical protein
MCRGHTVLRESAGALPGYGCSWHASFGYGPGRSSAEHRRGELGGVDEGLDLVAGAGGGGAAFDRASLIRAVQRRDPMSSAPASASGWRRGAT